MRTFKAAVFAAVLFIMLPALAVASDYYVDINNQTGFAIHYVYVSPAKSQSWEEDVLGKDILPDGTSRRVTLRGFQSSIFDIRLVDSDGDTYTFWNVDVARQDITARITDLDTD